MTQLADPIHALHHIGRKSEPKLKKLGIATVRDLLNYLPLRYEDLRSVRNIAELAPGQTATVLGRVELLQTKRSFRKKMMITELQLSDQTGTIRAVWFRQPYVSKVIKAGDAVYLSGKPKQTLLGLEFMNPVWEKQKGEQLHTAAIVPFYRLTEGLSHKQLRFLIRTALDTVSRIPDELPENIRRAEGFLTTDQSVRQVHWPDNEQSLERAITRLKFDELFWLQLAVAYDRRARQSSRAPLILFREGEIKNFVSGLPYTLTADQKKAAWRIIQDLSSTIPMNRLLQGDVGSGKTVVAGLVMLNVHLNGYQSLLMAPTEILALQHYDTLIKLLPERTIALLTAKYKRIDGKKISARALNRALRDGTIHIAVGTHSLIQEAVSVQNLGLAVVDEQHRFGVEQRRLLTTLGSSGLAPHLLTLSATPIPRSLALVLYGDLSISRIREKPTGRKPIITKIVPEKNRGRAYSFIREQAARGRQTFVICPLIDESDLLETKSVLAEHQRLQSEIFPDLRVGYLHGKMKADEKKRALEAFKNRAIHILVTTSVIEVGIDIPNASVMVIEGAERFGLAQLHQFRGRVGRSAEQSYCLLFPTRDQARTTERLSLLCTTQDGLELAEADLRMRGEGEVFGTRQSGIANFTVATIHDTALIKKSREWVEKIITADDSAQFYEAHRQRLKRLERIHWE